MHFMHIPQFRKISFISPVSCTVFVKCQQPVAVWTNEEPPQDSNYVPTNENTTRRVCESVLEESYTSHREAHTWK